MANDNQYDFILLGATGFTGKITAEYITKTLPSDLKWAVAGRNASKLAKLVEELKELKPDRVQPGVEQVQLKPDELKALVGKTGLILNAVGPYHLYGEPVVEACATTGTNYLDITGEPPFVYDMVNKYDTIARSNGAIIIPQIGFDSAPADMLVWVLVNYMRSQLSVGVKEVIISLEEMHMQASGGTLATVLGMFDHYSLKEMNRAMHPFSISPVKPDRDQPESLTTRLFGLRTVSGLGTLTTNPLGPGDLVQVHRSWGLFDDGYLYGKNFVCRAHSRSRNAVTAVMWHIGLNASMASLALIPPLRWLAMKLVTQPGDGPDPALDAKSNIQTRAIGYSDSTPSRRAMATLKYASGPYHLTAMTMAEAAMVLLRGEPTEAHRMSGGVLTPATLGGQFVDRLAKAGVKIDVKMLDD